jgi:light-regulated signal transduction histidine kinase (bacteriophytochrome)
MKIRESIFSPLGITAIYFVIGSLWIAFSDIWLEAAVADVKTLTRMQSYKGLFYIGITAFGLYYLLLQHRRTILKTSETYTKELENRVSERTRELSLLNKEMESFSYSVSHDLQAPLRAVIGFSQELVSHHSAALDPTSTDYLNRILKAGQRMSRLIDDLLILARVSRAESKPTDVDVRALIDDIISQLSTDTAYTKITVDIRFQRVVLHADESLLRILFQNLISNAFKYSSRGQSPLVVIDTELNAGIRMFSIRDNGIGFDMAYADKLFLPFQRLHENQGYEGSGIGLATVRRVMRHLHGSVHVDSQIGVGTVFYINLTP